MKKIFLFLLLGSFIFCSKNITDKQLIKFYKSEAKLKFSDVIRKEEPSDVKEEEKKVEKKDTVEKTNSSTGYKESVKLEMKDGTAYKKGSKTPYTGKLIVDYDDGAKAIMNYKNGKPHGEMVFYKQNGEVVMRGTFKNGEFAGFQELNLY